MASTIAEISRCIISQTILFVLAMIMAEKIMIWTNDMPMLIVINANIWMLSSWSFFRNSKLLSRMKLNIMSERICVMTCIFRPDFWMLKFLRNSLSLELYDLWLCGPVFSSITSYLPKGTIWMIYSVCSFWPAIF